MAQKKYFLIITVSATQSVQVYSGLPHQETWHIVHRAAAWASRIDGPKVTGRLCLTNISLDRTTTPQIPAGGMNCQLNKNRHRNTVTAGGSIWFKLMFTVKDIFLPGAASNPSLMEFSRFPAISLYLKDKDSHTEPERTEQSICYQLGSCISSRAHADDVKQHCVFWKLWTFRTKLHVLRNEDTGLYSVCVFVWVGGGKQTADNFSTFKTQINGLSVKVQCHNNSLCLVKCQHTSYFFLFVCFLSIFWKKLTLMSKFSWYIKTART